METSKQLCTHEIEGIGVCGRPTTHPIHQTMGITPLEHPFKRVRSGVKETMVLSKRNIRRIARRSGKTVDELEVMRQVMLKKGLDRRVTYDVLPENAQLVWGGLKASHVVMDEVSD